MHQELAELDALIGADVDGASPDNLRAFLKLVREQRVRAPEKVAVYGSALLNLHVTKLKLEELWSVYEQVAIAAMDIGARSLALSCVRAIKKQFPESIRAHKIKGMFYEATGESADAKAEYEEILKKEPLNQSAMRRLIALEKSSGTLTTAMTSLQAYLTSYSNDAEAWEEFAEMCVQAQMLRQAAFAYEELITLAPANPIYLTRYADITYSLGGSDNWKLARTYYAKALTVSGGASRRALYGVAACAAQLKGAKGRDEGDPELLGAVSDSLHAAYASECPEKLDIVDTMLAAQEAR